MNTDNSYLENRLVHDISGLDNLRKAALSNDDGALREAAKQFESIFMQMLIKSMRDVNAVFETDSPMNNQYTKNYRDMYDQQLSAELSSSGALGLADIIVKQLGGDNGNYKNAAHLKSLDVRPLAMNNSTLGNGENKAISTPEFLVPEKPRRTQPISTDSGSIEAKVAPSNATQPKVVEPVFSSPEEFVEKLMPIAEKMSQSLSVNPLTLVAQAALETGWGQKIAKMATGDSSLNLFGIKADKRWDGQSANVNTLEYKDGIAARQNASFRAYDSIESSVEDYVAFINENPRYEHARQAASAEDYMNALQQAGYATDPNYAKKVLSVLESETFKQAQKLHIKSDESTD